MPPRFLYFDLGMVLVTFSVDRMCRQMGEVAGIGPERVKEVIFGGDLQMRFELGQLSNREYYEAFCRATGTRPEYDALLEAGSAIFELNASMLPVVAQLRHAGYPMGILSNTCEAHWIYCTDRFRILDRDTFRVHALSFRLGVCKPDAAIFRAAAEMAGHPPQEIFFVDDIAGHVAGARAAGWDAVQYVGTPQLVAELRRRSIEFNY